MKKVFAAIIITIALPLLSQACNICGCSAYIGILPAFSRCAFGLRYQYRSLHAHVGVPALATYLNTVEKYNTVELWGAWNITNKIRITGALPYNFNELNNGVKTVSKNGLGDIYFLGYYKLFSNTHTTASGKLLVQNLWFGTGVELPSGRYDSSDKTRINESANLYQLGSGSTDVVFNITYDISLHKTALNVSSMYKINTVNKHDYEYGNRFDIVAQAYYTFNIQPGVTVTPTIGTRFENFQRNMNNGDWVETSGGNFLLATIGIEGRFKKITVGGNFQTPLYQNSGKEVIKANNICTAHISFSL